MDKRSVMLNLFQHLLEHVSKPGYIGPEIKFKVALSG